jgi:hypothetical protein
MTLNQVIGEVKRLVAGNKFINSLYFGEVSEWTEHDRIIYPNVLITVGDITPLGPEYGVDLTLYISDLLEPSAANRLEVFSDTLQIAQDLAADLNDQNRYPWIFDLTKPLQFFDDVRGNDNADTVGGVILQFTLRVTYIKECSQIDEGRIDRGILQENGLHILIEDGQYVDTE